jgi:outer membrane receptor protein involved in Fe transport
VVNLKAGYEGRKLGLYLELLNLANRLYSASVQVDNALGRYYEPAAGRSGYLGFRYRF